MEQTVELIYRPTARDFAAALRARRRASPMARRQRKIFAIGLPFIAFCAVMAVITGGGVSDIPVPLLVPALFALVAVPLMPRLQARAFQKLAERQGELRTVVAAAGLHITTDHSSTAMDWTTRPRLAEGPDVFVLLSPDKHGFEFTVLPKRAVATPAEMEHLRSLLDRHTTRA
ncbi:hypothetical protein [Streptomyces sp. AK02-01A]|uniref:hypothetical protein n=1 Tax=Streptomyces sp. AK02-01A TaxID=3028648 RepID=UPI0029A04749|nr:hypothetical protein [Streptomyces sp. AK02-01A]MDX3849633.1 hypothetical protein [Streptomyces sp. AK02-01A]MDX3849797.1 hypothetical protein [Streptomyces sp. AK02-01A]